MNRSILQSCDFQGSTVVLAKLRPAFLLSENPHPHRLEIVPGKPEHPSLRFKKLQAHENLWPVRINEQSRAVGLRAGKTIFWIWIGTHNEFDHLFS